MPRLALVVPAFPKLSETFIVSKFLGLLERGWDVWIVCGQSEQAEWKRFPELQASRQVKQRVRVAWPHRPQWLAALLTPMALAGALRANPRTARQYLVRGARRWGVKTIKQFYLDAPLVALKPDIVHFEFGTLAVGRMHLRELLGCHVVVSFRGFDLNYAGLDQEGYYHDVWEQADALHLLSEDLWKRAQTRGCSSAKPHALIPPAIDLSYFKPNNRQHIDIAGRPERPLRILSVGRLQWVKGYEYALEAIRHLRDQGIHCEYTIIGAGEYLEAIAFAQHQLGLESVVHLLGGQPREVVRDHLLRADVFLQASVSEGFCNAVIEAQAMAVPVVSSDAGGLQENVVDGRTGFIVPRRNPTSLAAKLAEMASSPKLRQRFATTARTYVEQSYNLDNHITAFDGFYRAILKADGADHQGRLIRSDVTLSTASTSIGLKR